MKLIFFIILISLCVTLSKKRKHRSTREPSGSESNSDEFKNIDEPEEDVDQTRFDKIERPKIYFSPKGSLRQNFAVELAFQNSGGNIVCSPVSALLPLGKLVFGAVDHTRQELYTAVGDYKKKDIEKSFKKLIKQLQFVPGVKLDLASKIYISDQASLISQFNNDVKEIFQSSVEKISFKNPKQAADEINGWVSRQTHGMVPLLLQPSQLSPLASLVIANAIYFKGQWNDPFKKIEVRDFHAPYGQKKTQLMINRATYKYTKSDVLNAQIVEIPYVGLEAAFVIVLPNERVGLPLLLSQLKLAPGLLNSAMENLTLEYLDLMVPKFSISSSMDLKDMYEKIGLKHMLGPRSGLTGIVKGQALNLTTAIQKAVIEVHEKGTTGSSASALNFIPLSAKMPYGPIIKFEANHPFLFFVKAYTEQIFAGIYSDP